MSPKKKTTTGETRQSYIEHYTDEQLLKDYASLMDSEGKVCLKSIGDKALAAIIPVNAEYDEAKAQNYVKARITRLNRNADFPYHLAQPVKPNTSAANYQKLADDFFGQLTGAQKKLIRSKKKPE